MYYFNQYLRQFSGGRWSAAYIILSILFVVTFWVIFQKAGEEGWAAIVPFYNTYVLFKITWGNGWLFLLLLIPIVNIIMEIITMVKLSHSFGMGGGFACGLIFLPVIFWPILAFGDYRYVGVNGAAPNYGGGNYSNGQGPQDPYQ